MAIRERALGRLPATDDRHIRKFGLTAGTMPSIPTPVVLGVNWYSAFDAPIRKDNAFWLPETRLGTVRGGHAICLKPPLMRDNINWWDYYDQGNEGACVGFASSRMMTLFNRERYNGFDLYHAAQKIDEWAGEDYDGTSVRAGMDILRTVGPFDRNHVPHLDDGIMENRWALSVEDIAFCLDPWSQGKRILDAGYVSFLNSWGRYYPHITRIPLVTLQRVVFAEQGDATVVVDRR